MKQKCIATTPGGRLPGVVATKPCRACQLFAWGSHTNAMVIITLYEATGIATATGVGKGWARCAPNRRTAQ
jgi:hypothetical protein